MKKLIYSPLIVVMLVLVGCVTDPVIPELPSEEPAIAVNPKVIAMIEEMGLSTEDIYVTDDAYIVEGDILISKEHFEELSNEPQTRQAKYSVTVRSTMVQNIKVYIYPDVGSSWSLAVVEALNEWNNIPNCMIGFSVVASSGSANVVVKRNAGITGNTIAQAYYPRNNCPGTSIEIGFGFDTWSDSFKKNVIVHELGHVLGFVHTDWKDDQPNSNSGTLISGTPDGNDNMSVMNHEAQLSWRGFSQGDIAAAQALYGIPIWSREITGPVQSPSISTPTSYSLNPFITYTLNLGTNLVDLNVSWYVNNVLKQNNSSLNFSPASLPKGQVSLKAMVNYGGVSYEANKVINVFDVPISGTDAVVVGSKNVQFIAPSNPITWATFVGWYTGYHGGTMATVIGGVSNLTLTIGEFYRPGICLLLARYRMPDGTVLEFPKTVTVRPPTPEVYSDTYSYYPRANVTFYTRFTSTWSYIFPIEYEWWVNGERIYAVTSDRLTTTMRKDPNDPNRMNVQCRTKANDVLSNWSNTFYLPR